MLHRTRIVYEYADSGLNSAQEIADIMKPLLEWSIVKLNMK